MKSYSTSKTDSCCTSSARPFFAKAGSGEHDSEAFFSNNSHGSEHSFIQTKCAHCAVEENRIDKTAEDDTDSMEQAPEGPFIQTKSAAGQGAEASTPGLTPSTPSGGPSQLIQRQADADEEEALPEQEEEQEVVQTKLTVGRPDDPYEQEADRVADQVVQRMHAGPVSPGSGRGIQTKAEEESEEETGMLQMKANSETSAGPAIESGLNSLHGGGSPLPDDTRSNMEDAFGVSFSDVRIHDNSGAQQLNRQLNARAFTNQTNIYFNSGEYRPQNTEGQRLLAHELTHVVQQSPGLQRKPLGTAPSIHRSSRDNRLMRAVPGSAIGKSEGVFGPESHMPSGTTIHNNALPLFVKGTENPSLFIEAPIPGSNKEDPDTGKKGRADFYKARATDGSDRAIGIHFSKTLQPEYLGKGMLQYGGARYNHPSQAAPLWSNRSSKIKNVDVAPTNIEIGDLKPGHSGEEHLGQGQINNYMTGIRNTAVLVNKHLAKDAPDPDNPPRWDPDPKPMSRLSVPDKLSKPSSGRDGFTPSPLAIYRYEGKWRKKVRGLSMSGSMVVYPSKVPGIWSYEWVPVNIPASIGHDETDKVLHRLNTEVIPIINEKGGAGIKKKSAAKRRATPQISTARQRGHQLQTKTFPTAKWRSQYGKWKRGTKKYLTSKEGMLFSTLSAVNKRTGGKVKLPTDVKKDVKKVSKIKHWLKFGGLYAWLKKTFGRVFDKLSKFVAWIRKKVQKLSKKLGGSSFGSWVKAAAKALLKVFKLVGVWAVNQVTGKLMVSLQTGVNNIISKLVDEATPENVKSKIEEFHELKAKYKDLIAEKQEELEKKIFGDKLKMFSELGEVMSIVNKISTIVDVVKWGIRIIACLSPPGLGCLWNLAIAALQYAFAKLMETCWFSQKVFKWIKDFNIRTILDFPSMLARHVVKFANKLIPLPAGLPTLFAPITINDNEFKVSCGGGGGGSGSGSPLSPEQQALLDFIQEVGEPKFKALMEVMLKHGAGPQVQLTADRIKELKKIMPLVSVTDLQKIAASKTGGKATPLEKFLQNIKQYTADEQKRIAKRKLDYKKAAKNNLQYQKSLGWKTETYVNKSGVTADSMEFADAIYDIQTNLGGKADGMLGPKTVVRFHDKNKLPKGRAYKKARKEIKRQKLLRQALAMYKQLIADLNGSSVNWSSVTAGHYTTVQIGKRKLLYGRTESGARVGAYFADVKHVYQGTNYLKIAVMSLFINIDPIPDEDGVGGGMVIPGPQPKFNLGGILFGGYKPYSLIDMSSGFIGLLYKKAP